MNKVLIVEATLHPDTADALSGAVRFVLEQNGIEYERVQVSGIFEIPAAVSIALDAFDYDGAIVVGSLIGQESITLNTIYQECARGVNDISIHFSLPIGFGIFMVENEAQALEQASAIGKQAAACCLELIKIKNLYQSFHNDSGSGYKN
ncbi:6,7-dimethyl-8-ribityllumazine synthase [Holosporaceae bacterium 'Namur']|nr:6,7-dimethyl-8-ribityllumazine synthase [Holosporaceae bacterium 'Namur']